MYATVARFRMSRSHGDVHTGVFFLLFNPLSGDLHGFLRGNVPPTAVPKSIVA